ncbi:lipopolysaccharide assembly protein LapB [Verrucomicrobium sp. 3C]|uniref:tetratricopeptide repeat protein n=1 Tax=Verrucomicrobium sp. 3C TaxID=1134055 RepID=UPI000372E572|nr:tetratricopeptide repeat protein [Verrucomicrobium sp. 3C]
MPVSFEVVDGQEGGFDYPSDPFDRVVEALDRALERRRRGEVGDRRYVAELERLVEAVPDFIDGYAHLGFALYDQGKTKKALDIYLRGLAVGKRLIPEGFAGHIQWAHLGNRPFLRALHGAALGYVRLRNHRDAAGMMERLLAYNPNDNHGVRYMLGSEYLRLGETDKARALLESECEHFPPYCYELALLRMEEGDWVKAATALRRGFCANPYIAEILCGNSDPAPLAVWHETNFAEPETAKEYLSDYADRWRRRPEFVAFLRWLYNHSRVLFERAAFLACMEELLWKQDFQRRKQILARMEKVVEEIDDRVSEAVVAKRKDRDGRSMFPWMHALTG